MTILATSISELFLYLLGVLFIFMVFKARVYIYMLFLFFLYIIGTALLLYMFGFEVLTFMLILVYAGAVVILFIYVAMLFQGQTVIYSKNSFYITMAIYTLVWTCFGYYFSTLINSSAHISSIKTVNNTHHDSHEQLYKALSIYLFTECIFDFIALSCMLLICFFGVVRLLKLKTIG